jgi:coenzyme F420-0:L-glutamate ligase/coenzyme F420-1:gamma-L-glutamate ligase
VKQEARRIVGQRDDLVIAETRHGFVCANAGVDASNVAEGFLTLLPEDPDASAERIRSAILADTGTPVGVMVTDTFGRPWREGLVNVAIGCAGLPSLVDLRGSKDAGGRVLEATVVALADESAAASGLVMGKANGIPAAIVRGVRAEEPPLPASAMVRPAEEDMFRESPLQALRVPRSDGRFGAGTVSRAALEEAVQAASAVPGPDGEQPWLFVATRPGPLQRRLLMVVAHEALQDAPVVVVPFARMPGETRSERDQAMVSGGAAIQSFMLAMQAQGFTATWVPWTMVRAPETRTALGIGDEWMPLGAIAAGRPSDDEPVPRPDVRADIEQILREAT